MIERNIQMDFSYDFKKKYEILKQIGEGGGGIVYLAYDKALQKKVVIKQIKKKAMFLDDNRTEVNILKELKNKYLPTVYNFISEESGVFTVMEYIEGESLQNMLDRGVKFQEKYIYKFGLQLCETIAYLHSQRPPVIHGDIKPDNIMITKDGDICLIDFNISGFLTGKGFKLKGYTPGYAPPELIEAAKQQAEAVKKAREKGEATQQSGFNKIDDKTVILWDSDSSDYVPISGSSTSESFEINDTNLKKNNIRIGTACDIYSIGATLYALLGGDVKSIGKGKLVFQPWVTDGMRFVVARCLNSNPEKRYPTAEALLKAFQNMRKMDKEYRGLLRKQNIKTFINVIGLAVAIVLIVLGSRRMEKEIESKYDFYVRELENAKGKDINEVVGAYKNAIDIHSDYLEPYYYKAAYMYDVGEYESFESTIEYIEERKPKGDDEMYSRLWYLMADRLFQVGTYTEAEIYYRDSIEADSTNVSLYRDYAICLAYEGKLEMAETTLDKAIKKGMSDRNIYMVKGEISRIKGEYEAAIDYFGKVIESTKDEQQRLRAYLGLSKSSISIGDSYVMAVAADYLEKAISELNMSNRLLIYEELGSIYTKIGEQYIDQEKKKEFFEKAIHVYEGIDEMGWANNVTYSNIIVLYQRCGNTLAAKVYAQNMIKKYPDNYVSYLRNALVEIEIQRNLSENERDYSDFRDYYQKAEYFYEKVSGNNTDSEMLLLKDTYDKLLAGGWIE